MRAIPSLDLYLVPWFVLLRAILASLSTRKLASVKEYLPMRGNRTAVILTLVLITIGSAAAAHAAPGSQFLLEPVNAACLPDAAGTVTVLPTEEVKGVDVLHLLVGGLPPITSFSVFLTASDAFSTPPFGAVQYIGDFTTNAAGAGSLSVRSIVDEAFSSAVAGTPPARVRADLDHVVMWFADPAQVPSCFNFVGSTPFDGDSAAGPAALSSRGATGLEAFPQ
jgi:hypothetical protein